MSDNLKPALDSGDAEPLEVRLKVLVDTSGIRDVPVLFANYAEVRANPEEVYLTFYQRLDQVAEVKGEDYTSVAVPKQTIIISPQHARRLVAALAKQLGLGELNGPGTDANRNRD